jgi:hypothetical protein
MVVGRDDADSSEPADAEAWKSRLVAPPPNAQLEQRPRPHTFSIAIASHQAADTIAEALDSARAQTVRAKEIIVCDDGSTDDIDEALAPYLSDIVFLRQDHAGEAAAKNTAARAASGDFVAFLDADDAFLPRRLEAFSAIAGTRPDLELLTTDAYLEVGGTPIRRCYEAGFSFESGDQRAAILDRNFIFGLTAVRRERFLASGGFDVSLRYATDWDLWCRLILDGVRVGLIDVPLARYRLHAQSLSAQRARLLRGRCSVLEHASGRAGLSAEERLVLGRALERERRDALLAELREALLRGGPDVRRLALRVARSRTVRPRTRLRAALLTASPQLARRALIRRERREGVLAQAGLRFRKPGC